MVQQEGKPPVHFVYIKKNWQRKRNGKFNFFYPKNKPRPVLVLTAQ